MKPAEPSAEATDDVAYERALDKAMRLLTHSGKSREELRRRLRRAGFEEEVVSTVEARLVELQILDDLEFARGAARWAISTRGESNEVVRQRLLRAGIDPGDVEKVLQEVGSEWPESRRALELARRRARFYSRLEPSARFRRLAGFISQRGYDAELVYQVCTAVLGSPADPNAGSD